MEIDKVFDYKWKKGKCTVHPANGLVSSWQFEENEEAEAGLAQFMSLVAEKNGVGVNELMHIFPLVLRMLKSKSAWTN